MVDFPLLPDDEAKKWQDELRRLLDEAVAEGKRLETRGEQITKAGRDAREVAQPTREIVEHLPPGSIPKEQMDHQLEVWRSFVEKAREGEEFLAPWAGTVAATSYLVSSTSDSFVHIVKLGPGTPPVIEAAIRVLDDVLHRPEKIAEAEAALQRLGLHVRRERDRKTAIELLQDAKRALGGPAAHVLIPIRESIIVVIDGLLKRRPIQEPAKNIHEKLLSIGAQCARPGLPPSHFERLAIEWDGLVDELSEAKQRKLTPEQASATFYRAVLFLNAFLSSIDETPLRQPKL